MKAVTPADIPVGHPDLRPVFACIALAALAVFAGGCASSSTEVKLDSLAKPRAADAISYEIRGNNPEFAKDSLRYKEAANYVKTALSGRGMYEAPPNTKADVVINLDFGISEPQIRTRVVTEPIVRIEDGGTQIQEYTIRNPEGGELTVRVPVQSSGHEVIDGTRERQIAVTVYEKYLHISARQNVAATEGKPPVDIWNVDVASEGESRDLRKKLPILVAATIDYVGKDSHGSKVIRIKDDDKDVAFVKKGM